MKTSRRLLTRIAAFACLLAAIISLAAACYKERLALDLEQEAYCEDTCDYSVRCNDAELDSCVEECRERFIVPECVLDRYLAAPIEKYGECIGALACDEDEDDCLTPMLDRDLLAKECDDWTAGCPFETDRTMCQLTVFMSDATRKDLRSCFRYSCRISEDFDYCEAIAFGCDEEK